MYEINITLNGKHLFATHERSLQTLESATKLYYLLEDKFPKIEGYDITVWKIKKIREPMEIKDFLKGK